ncbi:MAG: OmpA family protein [Cytophagaceae bacterium]|nr:OmpA family protein [Cytophagaceae bacterium]
MNRLGLPLLLNLLFVYQFSIAQSKVQLLDLERDAEINFTTNNFVAALSPYLTLDSLKPNQTEYEYRIGVCYLAFENNVKALPYLEKCLHHKGKHPAALSYYLGKAYQLSHRFDEAIEQYTLYKKELGGVQGKANKSVVRDVDRHIAMCENGKKLMESPVEISIKNLGAQINSEFPEYGPVISADESQLIFTSNRPSTTGGNKDPFDNLYYEDVYISTKKNGVWSAPVQMNNNINTENHDASIGFSPDGQTLFIYRSVDGNMVSKAGGDLYISTLKGNEWTLAEKLPDRINTRHWESSVSISEDGQTLFFTSNRPSGIGGTDIFICKKLPDGSWDKPKNLGPAINTPYDEENPVLHPDGNILYFSSKGHNSMGGFDIFYSRLNEHGKWEKPINMGYPVSTAHDDLHFAISTDGKRMYFSSVRNEGYGQKDLYCAEFKNKEAEKVVLLSGSVLDSITQQPVEATLTLFSDSLQIGKYNTNSATGRYTVVLNEGKNYQLLFNSPTHGSKYVHLDLRNQNEYREVERNIRLVQSTRATRIRLTDKQNGNALLATIKLNNLSETERYELDPAKADQGSYSLPLKEGNQYQMQINQAGYLFYEYRFFVPTSEQLSPDSSFTIPVLLTPISSGEAFEVSNLFYASEETKPLESSLPELKKVVEFLKVNPSTSIEISAHTDTYGAPEFNQQLSEKRAQEIVRILTESGIDAKRLVAKGYGSSKPLFTDESETAQAKNRRVEIKILKK